MSQDSILLTLRQRFEKVLSVPDRRASISHLEFVVSLVFCFLGDTKKFSLEVIRRSLKNQSGKTLERSSLWDRLSRKRLNTFLKKVIEELMCQWGNGHSLSRKVAEKLGVQGIVLFDSMEVTLNEKAESAFPGTFTTAALKWHVGFDLLSGMLTYFKITPGTTNDRKGLPEPSFFSGKLVLFDLGYWGYAWMIALEKAKGFFLSRVRSGAVLIIHEVVQGLSKNYVGSNLLSIPFINKRGDIIEVITELFHESEVFRFRVVGFWNPVEHQYHWYITNLSIAAHILYPLYRIRWQVELLFKSCKQSLNIDQIPSSNPMIIQNIMLASIAAQLCSHTLFAVAADELDPEQKLAVSLQRIAKVATTLAQDFVAFLINSSSYYMEILKKKINLFLEDLFDPNYKRRETSLARLHRLLENEA